MEVSLLDVQGLPPGCLVSVRSGTTRCQGPADPEKLRLFFPKGVKSPFKVDLLAPLGSADINYQPGANAYPVQVAVNGGIGSITLGVCEMEKPAKMDLNAISSMEYTKDDKGRPSTPATASRRHRMALQARTYLDDHQLLMFVQSVLQGLIRDRPEDPWEYINEASLSAKKLGVPEPYRPGNTPRDQNEFYPPSRALEAVPAFLQYAAPEDGKTWAEYCAPARPEVNDEGKLVGPWLEVMRAAVAFEHETPGWSSKPEFAETDATPATMVLEFLDRCGYAEFADALTAVEGEALAQYEAVGNVHEVPTDVNEATPVVSARVPQDLETGVKRNFMFQPSVGTWISCIQPPPPPPTEEEVDALRKRVWGSLNEASSNGRLSQQLKQYAEGCIEELRDGAVAALKQASQDGLHDKMRGQIKAMEELRKTSASRLLEAANNGSLKNNLKSLREAPADAADVKELQLKARDVLLQASGDGRLTKTLQDSATPQKASLLERPLSTELSNLRGEMRGLLVKAARDGSFEKALEELRPQAGTSLPWYPLQFMPWKPEDWPKSAEEIEAEAIENVRLQAKQLLLETSGDGRLREVLEASKQEKMEAEAEELRLLARDLLLKAGEDGSLLPSLDEVAKQAPLDEAGLMRKMAREMLTQVSDARFLAALQEAADAAGFEFELRPKSSGGLSAPSSPAPSAAAPASYAQPDPEIEYARGVASRQLVEACADGRFLKALEEASGEEAVRPGTADLDTLRDQARTKFAEASADGTFVRALQEAQQPYFDEELDEIRQRVRGKLEESVRDGALLQALDGSAEDAGYESEELQLGDECIERSTSRRFTVTNRSRGSLLLKAIDGTGEETWKSIDAVSKVPKLNLARAIDIQQEELYAPVHEATRGDEVQQMGNPRKRGSVLKRTTTDILLRWEDGTEAWHDVEDLEQVLSAAHGVVEGDEVINAQRGTRGTAKATTTSEILVLHDDGTEEWHGIEKLGRAKSRADIAAEAEELFNEIDVNKDGTISRAEFGDAVSSGILKDGRVTFEELEAAKGNAREALMAALIVDEELAAAKECARDALCTALLQTAPEEDVETAKANAREALVKSLLRGSSNEEVEAALVGEASDEELESARNNAREALFTALLGGSPDEDLEAAKGNAREALLAALLRSSSEEDLEAAKENARQALLGALGDDKGEMDEAKENARAALSAALFVETEDDEDYQDLESAKENARAALFAALVEGAPDEELEAAKGNARDALFAALLGVGSTDEASSEVLPESEKKEEPQPSTSSTATAAKPAPASSKRSQAQGSTPFSELEEKIRQRNDRFRIENDALRHENRRLKALWDKKQETDTTGVRKTGPDAS